MSKRQRERERERQRDRETERQRDRETERQRDRERERKGHGRERKNNSADVGPKPRYEKGMVGQRVNDSFL